MASETSTSNARDSMARAMASPSRPGAFAPRPPASLSAAGSSRALSARQAEAPPTRAAGAEHAKCVERERQGSSRAGFVDLDGGGGQPPPSALPAFPPHSEVYCSAASQTASLVRVHSRDLTAMTMACRSSPRRRARREMVALAVACMLCIACVRGAAGAAPAGEREDGDLDAMFASHDGDGDGALSMDEYGQMLSILEGGAEAGAGAHDEEGWVGFFRRADTSGDGRLSHAEWMSALFHSLAGKDAPGVPSCPAADAAAPAGSASARDGAGTAGSSEGARRGDARSGDAADFAMAFDANQDGVLDLAEFRELMSGEDQDVGEEDEEIDEVAEVFAKWDVSMDNRLSTTELQHGLNLAAGIVPDIPDDFYNAQLPDEFGRVVDPQTMQTLEGDGAGGANAGADARELFALVRAGDEKAVALWLQRHDLPDGGVNDGTCSPLHVALGRFDQAVQHLHLGASPGNHSAVALVLIDKGADLRHECEGVSPLLRAVLVRCLPVVRRILGTYADKVAAHQIPAHDMMVHYVGERHDLSPGGGTALHAAAYLHPVAIGVSKILTAHPGAGPANRLMRERGRSWRHHQLPPDEMQGRWDSISELLLTPHLDGALATNDDSSYRRAELQQALSAWNANFTAALLAAGLDANAKNLDGETPLHVAAHSGDLESARWACASACLGACGG